MRGGQQRKGDDGRKRLSNKGNTVKDEGQRGRKSGDKEKRRRDEKRKQIGEDEKWTGNLSIRK